jgi:tetratricopeptide (TPR) repeat protein
MDDHDEKHHSFLQALNDSAQLLSQNRPAEAVDKLLPLYEEAPEHPDVAINLSGAYILQQKWSRAIQILNKALQLNPENPMLWSNMGAAQLGRLEIAGPKQQEKAIDAYQRALRADPETPNVHYHLGLIYKERGELIRATAFFQRAQEVNPGDRDARYWLDRLGKLIAQDQQTQSDDDDDRDDS